jgi:hypothetical protein
MDGMKKNTTATTSEESEGTKRLRHYNEWLLDPKRQIGSGPYPGYPQPKGKKKMPSNVIANMTEVLTKEVKAAPAKATAKKAKRAGASPTKGELALQIYQRLNGDKTQVLNELQSGLGMSLAGATTYFYNAKKASQ